MKTARSLLPALLPALLAAATLYVAAASPAPAAAVAPADLEAARALYNTRGQTAAAQAAFEKLAAADPKNPDVNFHLGHLANRAGDPEKAVTYFEAALAAEPTGARHHHGLGDAYGRSAQKAGALSKFGFAKKSLAAYQRAVELAPQSVEFRQSLFEFYRQAPAIAGGGFDKAAAQAAEIKKLDPARGRAAFAALYAGEKKFAEAFAEFDEPLKANPDDFGALFQVGRLAANSGQQLARGETALRRCLQLDPPPGTTHAPVHFFLGQLLEKKPDPAAARAAYQAALSLAPDYGPAAAALKKLK